MKDLPAGTASALGIVEPMAATVFSIVIFREKVTVFSVIGIALILTAVFLLGKAENEKKQKLSLIERKKRFEAFNNKRRACRKGRL